MNRSAFVSTLMAQNVEPCEAFGSRGGAAASGAARLETNAISRSSGDHAGWESCSLLVVNWRRSPVRVSRIQTS